MAILWPMHHDAIPLPLPTLTTGHRRLDQAWRVALGDIVGNIRPYRSGLLEEPRPVLLAGLFYDDPWTRDAAINAWNGGALLWPGVARDTLLSCLERRADGSLAIGGQYWDAVIWVIGSWSYYCASGDADFLALALAASITTMRERETEEFDPALGLFRGGACYQDGISAYPDRYADTVDGSGGIEGWTPTDPALRHSQGQGFPAHALSTNCLYLRAYADLAAMATAAGQAPDPAWAERAAALREAINRHFWDDDRGSYRYLVDRWGGCERQEGLGLAFASLFQVADADRQQRLFASAVTCPLGCMPSLWPGYERYPAADPGQFGRHSTVWPHVNAFWADAALQAGQPRIFWDEYQAMACRAAENGHFSEIYHPETGQPYGGIQESGRDAAGAIRMAPFAPWGRQTWCATGFIRLTLTGLCGLRWAADGLHLQPWLPSGLTTIRLEHLHYRQAILDLSISPAASAPRLTIDGNPHDGPIPSDLCGHHRIVVG